MTIGSIIFFTWLVGFLTGYAAYYACKVGYKALMEALEEQALEDEKNPLKDGHPTVGNRV